MKVPGRIVAWGCVVSVSALSLGAAAASGASGSGPIRATSLSTVARTTPPDSPEPNLPPGVLPRSAILAKYKPQRPGVIVEAKLVTLVGLNAADPELAQCSVRSCQPGQLVWLLLEKGPPGSFPHSVAFGAHPSPGADAWLLFPVDAGTGLGLGDSEIGNDNDLWQSAWVKVSGLDPQG